MAIQFSFLKSYMNNIDSCCDKTWVASTGLKPILPLFCCCSIPHNTSSREMTQQD